MADIKAPGTMKKMIAPIAVLVLLVVVIAQGFLAISQQRVSREALATAKRWSAIAQEWQEISGRFEKIARVNLETAQSCIATLRKQTTREQPAGTPPDTVLTRDAAPEFKTSPPLIGQSWNSIGRSVVTTIDQHPKSFIFYSNGGPLFSILPDGKIERGPAFTTEDAASLKFWEVLTKVFPDFAATKKGCE